MSRAVFDENSQIRLLAAVPAAKSAPTVAEVTGGTDLTPFVTKDGLKYGVSNNRVAAGDISTSYTSEGMGTWMMGGTSLTCYLDDDSNTAWDALQRGTTGAVVILPFAGADATPAAGDHAYVIPCEFGQPLPQDSAENEHQKFVAEFAVTEEPDLDATVAA